MERKLPKLIDYEIYRTELARKFSEIAKEIIGERYETQPENKKIIRQLVQYFTGNESGLDPEKGIYLVGPYGVGKTQTMRIIQQLVNWLTPYEVTGKKTNTNGFQITTTEQIIDEFKTDGTTDRFGLRLSENRQPQPRHLLINEFGKPVIERIYGTDANELMNRLYITRYDIYQTHGKFTHATSNLKPSQSSLPEMIKDRFTEMFNIVEFPGTTLRK